MTAFGINTSSDGRFAPADLAETGAKWVRFVALPGVNLSGYAEACRAFGLKVLLVIARESLVGDYSETAAYYRTMYSRVNALQVGNESDHVSGSSWDLPAAKLNELLRAFRTIWPDHVLVGPGLVSGNPSYLDGVDLSLVNAISVHPYGQGTPNFPSPWGFGGNVGQLLDRYVAKAGGKPLWITEVGGSANEIGEATQANYCRAMLGYLGTRIDVQMAMWFSFHDDVDGFGLVRKNNTPRPAWSAFYELALQSTPIPGPAFALGFKIWHDLEPGLIGEPAEAKEFGFAEGVSLQKTTNGLLMWVGARRGGGAASDWSDEGPLAEAFGFVRDSDGARFRWRPGMTRSERVAA